MAGADCVAERGWDRHDGDPTSDRQNKPTIWRWQARFMAEGVDSLLHDATRPAGKPPLSPATIERVVEMTLAEPPGERTHWTCRAMAKAAGVSHRSVQRIWAAHGLKPHRVGRAGTPSDHRQLCDAQGKRCSEGTFRFAS